MELKHLHEAIDIALTRVREAYATLSSQQDVPSSVLRDILDVESALLAARAAELELQDELSRRSDDPSSVQFDGLVCWRVKEDGERDPHPRCPVCWDNDGRLIRLQRADPDYFDGWECRRCANHFGSRRALPATSKEDPGTRQW